MLSEGQLKNQEAALRSNEAALKNALGQVRLDSTVQQPSACMTAGG